MSVIEPDRDVSRLIDRTTATEAATKALRAIILSGEVPAGAPLRQDEVARRLGVSRTPLREALQRLEAEGLVRLDVHKGAVVAKPSIAQVSEIFELQQLLEPVAGRSAMARMTESDLVDLRDILASHTTISDPAAWETGNAEFHARLYDIARKPLLTEMIGQLRNRSGLYVHMLAKSPQGRARAHGEHLEMVSALEVGDTARLETLIRQHLQTTLEWLKAFIED
ncbi:MAG TPA: GntR family transcriptional regulator [Streptosporangiaceae bacterium]|nr:GntR family transcriptional regulator [Streptosporangiaceae bacterium]